jgi:hypothetical protein
LLVNQLTGASIRAKVGQEEIKTSGAGGRQVATARRMCDVIMLNAHACFGAKEDTTKQLFHYLRWPWHHSPAVLLLPFVCL